MIKLLVFFIASVYSFEKIDVISPKVILSGLKSEFIVEIQDSSLIPIQINIENKKYLIKDIEQVISHTFKKAGFFEIYYLDDDTYKVIDEISVISNILSIFPTFIAIFIALITKQAIPALFLGIWCGSFIINGFSFYNIFKSLFESFDKYIIQSIVPKDGDPSHITIIFFSMMLGGMIGIVNKNGGAKGIVKLITKWSYTSRRGQLSTVIFGTIFFIDDYANTLIVGNTIKPLTDKLRISREKLAYIIDTTAAPIACIALISTWIGYEVGLINDAISKLGIQNMNGYGIFLQSIKYSFYPILSLYFVYLIIIIRKDFGPMYQAENKARKNQINYNKNLKENLEKSNTFKSDNSYTNPLNAILPIIIVILITFYGLYTTGYGNSLYEIFGNGDPYLALTWASIGGVFCSVVITLFQNILTLNEIIEAWYEGLKSMLYTMIILILAWALSSITEILKTTDFFITILGNRIHFGLLPTIIFIVAALTSFSTGTSWGTMGILMPLTIPLVISILDLNGGVSDTNIHILYASVSAVLSGSVWGDHCSPISDTTILSSTASGCNHISHVKTQIPYALVVGLISILFGLVPIGFGVSWWICLLMGFTTLIIILNYFGKTIKNYSLESEL